MQITAPARVARGISFGMRNILKVGALPRLTVVGSEIDFSVD